MPERISSETVWRRVRRTVTSANPAAGAAPSLTVPAGVLYDVQGILATLVTSAVAANRLARLQVNDGNATVLDIGAPAVQAASLTNRYQWLEGGVAYSAGSNQVAPLPDLRLQEGYTVTITTDLLDPGDDWSALTLLLIETTIRGGSASLASAPELVVGMVALPAGS